MNEMEDEATPVEQMVVPDLTSVAGFSYEDVVYNADGRQSPAQQEQLRKRLRRDIGWTAFGLAYVAGGFALGTRIIPTIAGVFLLIGVIRLIRDAHEWQKGEVAQVDGYVQTEKLDDGESSPDYYARIAGWKLEITKEAYEALIPGGPYRIYFIAGPNRAVGGQVLPGWQASPPPEKKKGWFGRLSISIG